MTQLGADRFDLLVDWGWFYFITKPLFKLLHWLGLFFGNYGLAILATTVLVKLVFFPLANKSYELMAKMKMLQPEMEKMRERFKDDRVKQQQELMALYKSQENKSDGGVPADRAADPGVLRAVQGAVHHHRYAARAVLRLDQGPFGARPDLAVQPVRPAALRGARIPAHRRVAASSWASPCGFRCS